VNEALQEILAARALLDSLAVQGPPVFQDCLVLVGLLDLPELLELQDQLGGRAVQVCRARLVGLEILDRLVHLDQSALWDLQVQLGRVVTLVSLDLLDSLVRKESLDSVVSTCHSFH